TLLFCLLLLSCSVLSRIPDMLKKLTILAVSTLLLSGCDRSAVGDVSLGLFTMKDIKLHHLTDPIVTGVTCHIASIEADLSLADPSDSSISCR
ncbi:CreA family protein, partial [Proteus faecis]|uniref:CreA family protein n=1 Tax=Proteus faecis TaxID=2050967 RepID=UPI00301D0E30